MLRLWGGLSFHSYLPALTRTWARRTRPSLCVPLWSGARCVLDPAEGSDASARLTPVILPVGARAHRNLTFLSQEEEASYNRPLLHMTVVAEDAAVTIQTIRGDFKELSYCRV